jgi:hypothetical protein
VKRGRQLPRGVGKKKPKEGLKTVGWLSNVSLACDVDLCTIVMGLLRRPSGRPVVVAFPVTCRTTNQTATSRPLYGSVAAGLTIETRARSTSTKTTSGFAVGQSRQRPSRTVASRTRPVCDRSRRGGRWGARLGRPRSNGSCCVRLISS